MTVKFEHATVVDGSGVKTKQPLTFALLESIEPNWRTVFIRSMFEQFRAAGLPVSIDQIFLSEGSVYVRTNYVVGTSSSGITSGQTGTDASYSVPVGGGRRRNGGLTLTTDSNTTAFNSK